MGAIGGLLQGMVAGRELRMRMQQQADQHAQIQQEMESRTRQMQAQDLAQRLLLEGNSRPVDNGAVQDSIEGRIPDAGGQLDPNDTEHVAPILRPPDRSRVISYKNADGTSIQRELLTPEEQLGRRVAQAQAMQRATSVQLPIPKEMQTPGGPTTFWADPAHITSYLNQTGQNQLVDVPGSGGTAADGTVAPPVQVMRRNLPSLLNNQATNATRTATNAATNDTRKQVVGTQQAGANGRTDTRTDAQKAIADARNATTITAAGIRKAAGGVRGTQATPGQAGVQQRYDQKVVAADTEAQDAAQAEEQKQHALRSQIGAVLAARGNGTVEDGSQFMDPTTGKKATMNGLAAAQLKNKLDQATKRVQQLQDQQKAIRAKHGWGEFGGQGQAPATGGGKQLTDPAMAQQYLQKAGGDKNKARALASADGWKF